MSPSADVRDVWLSSEVILYERSLIWKSKCPARNLNISASLCWRQHEHFCTAAPNSTLVEDGGGNQLVCLAGLLVESVMESLFEIIKAFSNTPVFSSTEIQFICCGQTPSDVCAGEKEPDVPLNGMCPLLFSAADSHIHVSFYSFLLKAAITSHAPSRLVSHFAYSCDKSPCDKFQFDSLSSCS